MDEPQVLSALAALRQRLEVLPADGDGKANGARRLPDDLADLLAHLEAAALTRERLAAIVESSNDAIIGKTLDGMITSWNAAAQSIYGYTAAEAIGQPISILMPPDRADELTAILERIARGERVDHFETLRVCKDGRLIDVSLTVSPIRDHSGAIIGASTVARDISQRKAAEAQMRTANEQLAVRMRQSAADYSRLIETAQEGIWIIDTESRTTYVNPRMAEILGYQPEEMLGHVLFDFMDEEWRGIAGNYIERRRLGIPEEHDFKFCRKDGADVWAIVSTNPILDEAGSYTGAIAMITDITLRKLAEAQREAALIDLGRQSERRQLLHELERAILAAQAPDAIAEVAARKTREVLRCGRVSVVRIEEEREQAVVLGLHGGETVGVDAGSRFPLAAYDVMAQVGAGGATVAELLEHPELHPMLARLPEAGAAFLYLLPLESGERRIGGLHLWLEEGHSLSPEDLAFAEQVAVSLSVALRNAELYEQVRADREQLQALSRRLVQAQEEERKSIARELHDEAGQSLTALKIGLGILERTWDGAPAEAVAQMQELRRTVDAVVIELHDLSRSLRPASLDNLGLVPALGQLTRSFATQTGLTVDFVPIKMEGERLPAEVETVLYRIVQEALTNIARHAEASQVTVVLKRKRGRVAAIVEDNGRGFDVTEAAARGRLGLLGMRERAQIVSGRLTIESSPGSGTTVFVEVPTKG